MMRYKSVLDSMILVNNEYFASANKADVVWDDDEGHFEQRPILPVLRLPTAISSENFPKPPIRGIRDFRHQGQSEFVASL